MFKENVAHLLKMKFRNISIHNPEAVICRSPFGSDYSIGYFSVSLRAFHTWIVQHLPIILLKILQDLSNWLLSIARQTFSGLAIDLSQNCNSATQEYSLSSWKATPV
jgi:hypothetical protein